MSRFSKPLIVLALAILPFFLFLGTTDSVRVNGELVSDNRFNLGGLVMAVIGLGMVFGMLRPSAPRDGLRKALAALAGLLCLVQVANSVDIIRIDPLDWIMPDRNLPELQYSGLADNDYIYLTVKTPDTYRRALTREKGDMVGEARIHQAYVDLCHGGRYRVDLTRATQIPDYFDAAEQTAIEERATTMLGATEIECTLSRSNRLMGAGSDQLNRSMDLYDRLEAEYLALAN
ncbi:MAG: hypothetical protein P0Y65_14615 [Candidatus Devosia phytovorans]|uniref:Uncharacterized protein n=1 Tax=Candidatus Devosia phytovorans TaxID=3121372 RepID=A0AAJ5VT40_9HYPH|nr:hypothetical protein [Devosia sp.]WEK03420.1 MAG: hypothetical protein P0Y65_14615 [Devosia sp.]